MHGTEGMVRTMMSLEQAIKHAERAYKESRNGLQYALKRGETKFAERCEKDAEENRQLAAWLRELQERRKAPEIIRCKDCKHYEWMSNRIPEEQTWHCHCWDADTGKDDFCSYAERRSE